MAWMNEGKRYKLYEKIANGGSRTLIAEADTFDGLFPYYTDVWNYNAGNWYIKDELKGAIILPDQAFAIWHRNSATV